MCRGIPAGCCSDRRGAPEPLIHAGRRGPLHRRARPRARRRSPPPGDPPRASERPRVLRAAHCECALLPARGVRRAPARPLAARVREGALTMTVGMPGTGIGGMFYLLGAPAAPLSETLRRMRPGAAGGDAGGLC